MTAKELRDLYYLEIRHKSWSRVDELIESIAKDWEASEAADKATCEASDRLEAEMRFLRQKRVRGIDSV